jgi:hypothetical protein
MTERSSKVLAKYCRAGVEFHTAADQRRRNRQPRDLTQNEQREG